MTVNQNCAGSGASGSGLLAQLSALILIRFRLNLSQIYFLLSVINDLYSLNYACTLRFC